MFFFKIIWKITNYIQWHTFLDVNLQLKTILAMQNINYWHLCVRWINFVPTLKSVGADHT